LLYFWLKSRDEAGKTQKEQGSATDQSVLLRHNTRALANQMVCYIEWLYPTYIIMNYQQPSTFDKSKVFFKIKVIFDSPRFSTQKVFFRLKLCLVENCLSAMNPIIVAASKGVG
jgi:hypothetical protein